MYNERATNEVVPLHTHNLSHKHTCILSCTHNPILNSLHFSLKVLMHHKEERTSLSEDKSIQIAKTLVMCTHYVIVPDQA